MPSAAPFSFYFDGEKTSLLQTVQQWIDRAWTHLVAIPSKLFDHPEANQRLLRCVVKNVQPDKTAYKLRGEQVLCWVFCVGLSDSFGQFAIHHLG
jgi:hypothetical protein